MDFEVTVRTYTGAVKTLEINNMPDEEAARAEAIGLTFGQVLSITRLDVPQVPDQPKKKPKPKQIIERELKPGETEIIITGYNSNPLAVFSALNGEDIL